MEQPRVIGHVVSINGFRLKVELSTEAKSSSRATPDGIQRAVAINALLTFDLGAGAHAVGLLSDLEARESYDPSHGEELSLELTKPRRIASVQLLGTVRNLGEDRWQFDTGITILPTLDTPAEVAHPGVLSSIFSYPPLREQHHSGKDQPSDASFEIGHLTGDENSKVKASFNDLFSRPLAVVGNTGSGKSYTVASLLRGVIEHENLKEAVDPHIFILDINGEYANALLPEKEKPYQREPNKIYLGGEEFCLPAWLMNGEEICEWLQASEATQEPVLKDWWAIAKSDSLDTQSILLGIAINKIESAVSWLDDNKPVDNFDLAINHAKQYADASYWKNYDALEIDWSYNKDPQWRKIKNDRDVRECLEKIKSALLDRISQMQDKAVGSAKSVDAPRCVALHKFRDPNLIDRSTDYDSNRRIDQYLLTLKLRLKTRLDDRRWQSFFSFEEQSIFSFEEWMSKLGVGRTTGSRVSILDLSMLASDTIPYVCAILGRLLLESREMLSPDVRSEHPWLLVLEEAHNYARPLRAVEDRGLSLSRKAFERVAKEGRKFGLSLIVASQRPSEISPTIISQCANFFSHRLQNPDDIDHFRRIIPKQAQRLLDQVTVLAAGEAIVFGSAMHVPARVQVRKPTQEPWSFTATPFRDWAKGEAFPLGDVIENWGLSEGSQDTATIEAEEGNTKQETVSQPEAGSSNDQDPNDDIPF